MAQGAAVVLALSLIVAGLAILGDALGWFTIPGDLWAAVIVLLGTAGRFVSSRTRGADGLELAPEPKADEDRPNGTPPRAGPLIMLLVLTPTIAVCSGAQLETDALAWAKCAGGGALQCAPAAANDDHTAAAINYASCLSARAIACIGPLVARENPPAAPEAVREAFDLGCVQDVAARCAQEARRDHQKIGRHESGACIELEIVHCYRGGKT
jgi:hypothetical protein